MYIVVMCLAVTLSCHRRHRLSSSLSSGVHRGDGPRVGATWGAARRDAQRGRGRAGDDARRAGQRESAESRPARDSQPQQAVARRAQGLRSALSATRWDSVWLRFSASASSGSPRSRTTLCSLCHKVSLSLTEILSLSKKWLAALKDYALLSLPQGESQSDWDSRPQQAVARRAQGLRSALSATRWVSVWLRFSASASSGSPRSRTTLCSLCHKVSLSLTEILSLSKQWLAALKDYALLSLPQGESQSDWDSQPQQAVAVTQ